MKVEADISHGRRENEWGIETPVTIATCTKCGHECWAWGEHGGSEVAALTQLRQECPEDENNYYE